MKIEEKKPKNRTFTLTFDLEEAEMLKAITGTFNSVGQDFTSQVWEFLEEADVKDKFLIKDWSGKLADTLEVAPK